MKKLVLAVLLAASVGGVAWYALFGGPLLIVFNGATDDWTVVRPTVWLPRPHTLGCLSMGQWALWAGERDGTQVIVDTHHRTIIVLPTAVLERAAHHGCQDLDESTVRRVALRAQRLPGTPRLIGDMLYVTYYGDNLIERYRWPSLDFDGVYELAADRNLGVSDVAVVDGKLWATTTGQYCMARVCPNGRLGESKLFDLSAPAWPYPSVTTANKNASSLAQNTAGTFVVMAGDFDGGYSSLQRFSNGALGPELQLPRNGAAAEAILIDAKHLLVRQFHGAHLFVIDLAADALQDVLRFEGQQFVPVPFGAHPANEPALPERGTATFDNMLKTPNGDVLLVDTLGQRLVMVALEPAAAGHIKLTLRRQVSLVTRPGNSGPGYARWVN